MSTESPQVRAELKPEGLPWPWKPVRLERDQVDISSMMDPQAWQDLCSSFDETLLPLTKWLCITSLVSLIDLLVTIVWVVLLLTSDNRLLGWIVVLVALLFSVLTLGLAILTEKKLVAMAKGVIDTVNNDKSKAFRLTYVGCGMLLKAWIQIDPDNDDAV